MLIDIGEFQRLLAQKGFQIVEQENRSLPAPCPVAGPIRLPWETGAQWLGHEN